MSPSRASDALLIMISALAIAALLPIGTAASVALAILTTALIVWPFGVLMWLARRWARVGDMRFVALAILLVLTAVGAALAAISLSS